jgi:hypothetical protein
MRILIFFLLFNLTSCVTAQNDSIPASENKQITQTTSQDILNVSLCELIQSSEKFEQKTVRLKAVYRYGFEWSEFYSLKCETQKRVWVDGEQSKCENADRFDEMDFAGMGGRTFGVVAIGQFTAEIKRTGNNSGFDYSFKVKCFEHTEMLDRESNVLGALTPEQRHKVEEFENSN